MSRLGLLAGLEVGVRRENAGHRLHAGELVRKGVDASGTQRVELCAPDGEQLVSHGRPA